jgi:hypothetical protein
VRALPTARISSCVCVINNSLAPLLLYSPSPPVAHLCDSLEVAGAAAVDLCPEWTRSEVLAYVAIYLRVAGFCALGSGLYVAAGARRRLVCAPNEILPPTPPPLAHILPYGFFQ